MAEKMTPSGMMTVADPVTPTPEVKPMEQLNENNQNSSNVIKFGTASNLLDTSSSQNQSVQKTETPDASMIMAKSLSDIANSFKTVPSKDALKNEIADTHGYRSDMADLEAQNLELYKQLTNPATDIFSNPNLTDAEKQSQYKIRQAQILNSISQVATIQGIKEKQLAQVTEDEYNKRLEENEKAQNALKYLETQANIYSKFPNLMEGNQSLEGLGLNQNTIDIAKKMGLNKSEAVQVQNAANYKTDLYKSTSVRSDKRESAIAAAQLLNPDFSPMMAQNIVDFETNEKNADRMQAIAASTAVQHLAEFGDVFNKLDNSQLTKLNELSNWIKGQTGDVPYAVVKQKLGTISAELAKVYKSSVTDQEINSFLKTFDPNNSPEANEGIIASQIEQLTERQDSVIQQYRINNPQSKYYGKLAKPDMLTSFWTPKAQDSLKRMGFTVNDDGSVSMDGQAEPTQDNTYSLSKNPIASLIPKDSVPGIALGIMDVIQGMMNKPSRLENNYKGRL